MGKNASRRAKNPIVEVLAKKVTKMVAEAGWSADKTTTY